MTLELADCLYEQEMLTLCIEVELEMECNSGTLFEDIETETDQQLYELCEELDTEIKPYSSPILPLNSLTMYYEYYQSNFTCSPTESSTPLSLSPSHYSPVGGNNFDYKDTLFDIPGSTLQHDTTEQDSRD